MIPFWKFLLAGILSVVIPLLSMTIWAMIFSWVLPGSRKTLSAIMRFDQKMIWRKELSLSLSQLLFYMSVLISVSFSLILEIIFFVPAIVLGLMENAVATTILISLAGPAEESMKLLAAFILHLIVMRSFRFSVKRPDKVKVGMIVGLMTGAFFGIVESIGYLSISLNTIITEGISMVTMDEFLFRAIFGVAAHAMFTGLAAGGLGRHGKKNKLRITAILLPVAIVLHSANNFIEGLIVLVMNLDENLAFIITTSIQVLIQVLLFTLLYFVWKGKMLPQGYKGN